MFDKDYFENFGKVGVGEYLETFPVNDLTVTIRVAPDHEFHLYRVLKCDDGAVTFAYYDPRKQKEITRKRQDVSSYLHAFPVITIPYGEIRWVEFNPGKIAGAKQVAGFRYEGPKE